MNRPIASVEQVFADYRDTVALVAASAEEQIRWMDSTGLSADELRCGIDDIKALEDRLTASLMLSPDAIRAVRTLLTHMDSMTDHDLWVDDALLASHEEWAAARILAREALDEIDAARRTAVVSNDVEWVRNIFG